MLDSDDWLETSEEVVPAKPGTLVSTAVAVPTDIRERVALVEGCWARLTINQRTFLTALRECGMNARAANRRVRGGDYTSTSHTHWMNGNADYATVVTVWRSQAASDALDRDRLLARQDNIVETLMIPKPILHQGMPTGFEEVNAAAAGRANEALMTAAGILKSGKDVEVNVGVAVNLGVPTLNIQVMPTAAEKAKQGEHVVIDAKFTEVPSDEQWLDT